MESVIIAEIKQLSIIASEIKDIHLAGMLIFSSINIRKSFCSDCLKYIFIEDSKTIFREKREWLCPFKRKICDCGHCTKHYH
jgi:hypothetical protein